ncbi:metallophosphoesterase [bacterium]|nr:metallophosphoesterase [bacterium]
MKILTAGDVVGRRGREAVLEWVPKLRAEHKLDCVIVNVDNASGGFGVTPKECDDFFAAGCDILTGGDHVWDQKDLRPYLNSQPKLLRPLNYPDGTPGRGEYLLTLPNGKKVLVLHALGQVFLQDYLDSPFDALETALQKHRLGNSAQAIIVDFHAEATSEKMAMGHFLDGRVSAVVGGHTHVPTADATILKGGTAYQTDLGMCGDYDSVIGFRKDEPLQMFTRKMRKVRMEPAMGRGTFCGAIIETDDKTGLAKSILSLKLQTTVV